VFLVKKDTFILEYLYIGLLKCMDAGDKIRGAGIM